MARRSKHEVAEWRDRAASSRLDVEEPMVKKVAIAILAAQMMAGLCQFDAGVRGGNSCCKPSGAPCPIQMGCVCCNLNSVNLPSLTAQTAFKVAPATLTVVVMSRAGSINLRPWPQAYSGLRPTAAPSPPPLYLLNLTLLI